MFCWFEWGIYKYEIFSNKKTQRFRCSTPPPPWKNQTLSNKSEGTWYCLSNSMGGWAPYVSSLGMFKSSTKMIILFPAGAPLNINKTLSKNLLIWLFKETRESCNSLWLPIADQKSQDSTLLSSNQIFSYTHHKSLWCLFSNHFLES